MFPELQKVKDGLKLGLCTIPGVNSDDIYDGTDLHNDLQLRSDQINYAAKAASVLIIDGRTLENSPEELLFESYPQRKFTFHSYSERLQIDLASICFQAAMKVLKDVAKGKFGSGYIEAWHQLPRLEGNTIDIFCLSLLNAVDKKLFTFNQDLNSFKNSVNGMMNDKTYGDLANYLNDIRS